MPRITADQAEQIGNSGQNCFFGLSNDKDQALVRFLINDQNDLDIYPVHRIELNGMTKSVECLRAPGDPIDACPFCREKYFSTAKIYIPLIKYSVNGKDIEPEVNIWERGKTFIGKMQSIATQYQPVYNRTFTVIRNGKQKDPKTSYEILPLDKDGATLEDLPQKLDLAPSKMVVTKDEMEYYIQQKNLTGVGCFPERPDSNNGSNSQGGVQPRPTYQQYNQQPQGQQQYRRETF